MRVYSPFLLTAWVHLSALKRLVKDQALEYPMALHNAWIIEFILYFRDHFPPRRSDDLKGDVLHSMFSAGKQLFRTLLNSLFLHTENFAIAMDRDVNERKMWEYKYWAITLKFTYIGSKFIVGFLCVTLWKSVFHKGLALTLKNFPLPSTFPCVVRIWNIKIVLSNFLDLLFHQWF